MDQQEQEKRADEMLQETSDALQDKAEAAASDDLSQKQEEQEEPPKVPFQERLREFVGDVLDICESVIVSVFVVLLVFTFVLRPVTVDGTSMLPTLEDEDRVLMFEWFYTPEPGDVVIVDGTNAHLFGPDQAVIEQAGIGINLVKRVIAVEGQELNIDFTKGQVFVDGVLLEEDYINALTTSDDRAFTYPITIPEGYVFVMGDNRNASTDSRSRLVGLVDKDDIIGHALVRFYRTDEKRESWADQFGIL
ncbi:MAG: signal peptidase I [Ruminococcus sp.]|nr:signal peptidase I [Ruminococcus sp.]